jgi:hypothetical protein
MDSKQINFYLTQKDQEVLESELRSVSNFLIAEAQSPEKKLIIRPSIVISRMGAEPLKIILLRPDDKESVNFLEVSKLKSYAVDTVSSPVVEMSRCYVAEKELRRGRFYYKTKYFDGKGNKVSKSSEFLSWADKMTKIVRKCLQKEDLEYFGEEATKLSKECKIKLLP